MKRQQLLVFICLTMMLNLCLAKAHTQQLIQAVGNQPYPSLAPLLKQVIPAVVSINAFSTNRRLSPYQRYPYARQRRGLGAGVIFDAKRGYIVTNNHVVRQANKIMVILGDGRQVEAKLIGRDLDTDVAVIQIPGKNLQALSFGNSDQLQVGDFVIAIGNPYGLSKSVTSGIVSGLGRRIGRRGYENFIQTDAPINPGNSGGALVNLKGELVGINTAIISPDGGNVGVGFAIPSNMVQHVAEQIIKFGSVQRGVLGIKIQTLSPPLAKAFRVPVEKGALVAVVESNSAAAKVKLRPGDVIVKIGNITVNNSLQATNAIAIQTLGKSFSITYYRKDKEMIVTAQLQKPVVTDLNIAKLFPPLNGAHFETVKSADSRIRGVRVTRINIPSYAWHAGIRTGDIIVSVNQNPVGNLQSFKKLIQKYAKQRYLLLQIHRGMVSFYLVIQKR